jgi:hypothetical protein
MRIWIRNTGFDDTVVLIELRYVHYMHTMIISIFFVTCCRKASADAGFTFTVYLLALRLVRYDINKICYDCSTKTLLYSTGTYIVSPG